MDYINTPPPGWRHTHKGTNNRFVSPNMRFILAAWGADMHTPIPSEDNHVRCYYGYDDSHQRIQVSIETDDIIQEQNIAARIQWEGRNHYYMCGNSINASECSF